jgi:hypothetical protein
MNGGKTQKKRKEMVLKISRASMLRNVPMIEKSVFSAQQRYISWGGETVDTCVL